MCLVELPATFWRPSVLLYANPHVWVKPILEARVMVQHVGYLPSGSGAGVSYSPQALPEVFLSEESKLPLSLPGSGPEPK